MPCIRFRTARAHASVPIVVIGVLLTMLLNACSDDNPTAPGCSDSTTPT